MPHTTVCACGMPNRRCRRAWKLSQAACGQVSSPNCRHHDGLKEHTVIEPGTPLQVAVDGEDQSDRCVEEGVVARVLSVHLVLIRAADAERAVESPTAGASPRKVGLAPFHRIVVVLARAHLVAVITCHRLAYDLVAHPTFQHPHMPWLHVAARR